MANTIKLKKYSDVIEEYVAAGTITPGHLVEFDSNGAVAVHSEDGGNAVPIFALEDELQGNAIGEDYSATDRVQCWIPYVGDQVLAWLSGEAVVKGDYLQSAGDGSLKKFTTELKNATLEHRDGDDGLDYTAREPGYAGNAIRIVVEYDAGVTAGSETVDVSDTTITVGIQEGESSFDQVKAAIDGDADASALVIVETEGTSSEDATEIDDTLSGGEDVNPGQIVAQSLEDTDPSGDTVRHEVRVV